jgi:hypothetical protein
MITFVALFAMLFFPSHFVSVNDICRPGDESPAKDGVVSCGGSTGGTPIRSGYVADDICPQHGAYCYHV